MTTSAQPPLEASRPPTDVVALLAELARLVKGRRFYGPGSDQLTKLFGRALAAWQAELARGGSLAVEVTETGFVASDGAVLPGGGPLSSVHGVLVQREVRSLEVSPPLEAEGFAALLEVLVSDPARLADEGGFASALYARAPLGFTVNDIVPPMGAAEPTPAPEAPVEPAAASGDPDATDPMLGDLPELAPPEPAPPEPAALEPAAEPVEVPISEAATSDAALAEEPIALPASEPEPAVAPDAEPPLPTSLLEEADGEAESELTFAETPERPHPLAFDPEVDLAALVPEEPAVDPDADTITSDGPLVEPPGDEASPLEDPSFAFMDDAPQAPAEPEPEVETPSFAPAGPSESDFPDLEDELPDFEIDPIDTPAPEATLEVEEPSFELDAAPEAEPAAPDLPDLEIEMADAEPEPEPAPETPAAEGDESLDLDFGGESLEIEDDSAAPESAAQSVALDAVAEPEEVLEFGFDDDARAPEPEQDREQEKEAPAEETPARAPRAVAAAAPAAASEVPEGPEYAFEVLRDLEDCEDPIQYEELASRAGEAAGRLVEKSFSAEAFTVLRTLGAHAGDNQKRSPEQRSSARQHMLALARGPLLADLIQRACSNGDGSLEANQILLELGGDATLPVFKAAAVERNADRRERLHAVLISLGEDSLPDLLRLMRDEDPVQVRTAVRLAGEIQNPGAVPRLAEMLEQPVAALSQEVCKALVRIGDASALKVLCDGLSSEVAHVPALAAYALGSSGSPVAAAALLQALHRAMEANQSEFAREVIRGLGRLGRAEATPDLASILLRGGLLQRRRLRELKLAAAAALGRLPGDEAVGALAQAAQSRDAHIRRAAQIALDRRAQVLAGS